MSKDNPKKRMSASLRKDTIERIEEYQDVNNIDSRSEAIESLINGHPEFEHRGGLMSALVAVAGDELPMQIRQFGWLVVATAVSLLTYDAGVFGGLVWGAFTAVFGLLAFFNFIGILAGVVGLLDPDPVGMPEDSGTTDEVEA
jgi:hypothetical protein